MMSRGYRPTGECDFEVKRDVTASHAVIASSGRADYLMEKRADPPMSAENPTAFFWEVAQSFLEKEAIARGTMMGFPCLRADSKFFASADPKSGDLIVKLPAARVGELIEAGAGSPFAPAGRRFREWVVVSERSADQWRTLMEEAARFVGGRTLPIS